MALVRKTIYGGPRRKTFIPVVPITIHAFLESPAAATLVFLATRNLWHLLSFPIFLFYCFKMEKNEPQFFHLIGLWFGTTFKCLLRVPRRWGGASIDPLPFRPKHRRTFMFVRRPRQ